MVPKISGVNYERRVFRISMACVQGKIGSSLYAGSVELSEEFKKKYIELYGRLLYNQRISRIFNKDGVVWTVD